MKISYKKIWNGKYTKYVYFLKKHGNPFYAAVYRKSNNKKRFNPERWFRQKYKEMIFIPKPTPITFSNLPCFQIEDIKVQLRVRPEISQ